MQCKYSLNKQKYLKCYVNLYGTGEKISNNDYFYRSEMAKYYIHYVK